ncbi:MAG: hypothetical protein JNM71_17155 [Flavobacterium lindanitolerans]|uniref:hypothetical protein n=1 Tax=Flavobacterium lindanitolerans TaxID=428988 RepID=UPI001A5DB94E|nr:hypothetical protein [Flavobacterium lindanitolerans]MBL7869741.1 hypothetical protein [Flavobacterium lindanitolerans]
MAMLNLHKKDLQLGLDLKNEYGVKITQEYLQTILSICTQLFELANKNTVSIADVNNFEKKNIIPQLLKYSIFSQTKEVNGTINNLRILSNLLKAKIVIDANAKGDLKYNEDLNSILTFVSNLDKLDKAETYQSVIDLVQQNNENVAI